MEQSTAPGGAYAPAGASFTLGRFGFGAMRLTGPMAWGPPRDLNEGVALLREAARRGVNHIDTSDEYGPHVANEIIREALFPYRSDLRVATKVGMRRSADKGWVAALSATEITQAVHDNRARLGVDALDIVNLRVGEPFAPNEDPISEPLSVLAGLQAKGFVKHIGLSNISRRQFVEARKAATIVCVQNHYNLTFRRDDALIDELAELGVAYVPFFPLGGPRPIASPALDAAAAALGATPRQIALAWLLRRAPNILIIAGVSSLAHFLENLDAVRLQLPAETVDALNHATAPPG
jgi:pyridoxine 4-dehydrogenase